MQGKKEDVTLKKLGVKNVRKMLGGALAVLMLVGGLGMTANASGIDVEQTDDATTWTEANNDYGYWYVNKVTKECVTPGWHVQHTKDRDTNVKYQYDFYVDSNGYVKWSNLFIDGYQSNTESGQKKWDWKSDANGWYYTNGEEYLYKNPERTLEDGNDMGIYNIDGITYAFDTSGYLVKPNTWVEVDAFWTGGWYYVGDTEGVCLDGWQQIDGTWYYFFKGYRWLDCYGVMATDEYVDGYYLTESGALGSSVGEWHQDEKGWWFGDQYGWYAKDERIQIDHKYYDFDENGYLKD